MADMEWIDLVEDRKELLEGFCEHGSELLRFHKMLSSSGVIERLAASHEGLSSMELVSSCNIRVSKSIVKKILLSHTTNCHWKGARTFPYTTSLPERVNLYE
jgi:hypothetical protein